MGKDYTWAKLPSGRGRVLHAWQSDVDRYWGTLCKAYQMGNRDIAPLGRITTILDSRCPRCERALQVALSPPKARAEPSPHERALLDLIRRRNVPEPLQQQRPDFLIYTDKRGRVQHPSVDLYYPMQLIIEVQGGIWITSKHNSGPGLLRDYRKLALATVAGVPLLFCPPEWIKDETIIGYIKQVLRLP
jgi:hypothetical protein